LTCILAFLLASTPAHNSDLWLHLASGRLLSAGQLFDGTEPFSSTTKGVFWANPGWLSDVLGYQVHRLGGGTALVVAKALLVALLAALWFAFRRPDGGTETLFLAGLAALLAMGPWLLLQPVLLSLVGVVLTLYLLERPSLLEGAAAERARAGRWLLVPLFALWANLDGWFLLGPSLVGLYAVGELLSLLPGQEPSSSSRKRAAGSTPLLALAGLAACLATPYHYHAFAWPTPLGLTPTEQALRQDPLGQGLVVSPFGGRFASSPVFYSPGAWAYYLLLVAGAASFVLARRNLQPGRLLAWLALAALSIYQARAIPFFAVAGAPLLALNVQDWAHGRPLLESRHRLRDLAPPVGVLLGVVLLVLVWPGWLQPAPYQARAWTAEPDGSLERMAQWLSRRHAEGRFRPDHFALTFSPEVAHHLAWLCPAEKGFLDSRWPLFERVAEDYVRMRRSLLREGDADAARELASLLDAHRIDRVLLHDTDWDRTMRAYRHLSLATAEWELVAVEGGATLFRRRAGEGPSPEAFEYRRAAYHPDADRRTPSSVPPPPRPRQWFDAFLPGDDERSADREEAALHLLSFDLQAERRQARASRQWLLAQATGLAGCACPTDPAGGTTTLAVRLTLTPLIPASAYAPSVPTAGQPERPSAAEQLAATFLALHGGGPPEPLLLAVRAARRALALNPDDAGAFLLLGEAYFRLARQTPEAGWQGMLPRLAALRQAQILTALEQAVLLRPDLDQAHALLVGLYYEQGQMDRCLDHLRARLRLAEQAAKGGGPEPDATAGRRAALQEGVESMEKLLERSEKTYRANLPGKTDPSKVLQRAQLAARSGLSRKALEMLLESDAAIFGAAGAEYELQLLLQAGQAYKVRVWLTPEHEEQIDFFEYHWIKARAAASCGDYAEADTELERSSLPLRVIALPPGLLVPVRSAVAFHVAKAVLARLPAVGGVGGAAGATFHQYEAMGPLGRPAELMRQEADREVLRGVLALESGAVEAARQHFRNALGVWGGKEAAAAGAGLDFPARPIAEQALRRLQE
jgi:tetratricopeptide (TPR) repeat protein